MSDIGSREETAVTKTGIDLDEIERAISEVFQLRASLQREAKEATESWRSFAGVFTGFGRSLENLIEDTGRLGGQDHIRERLNHALRAFNEWSFDECIDEVIKRLDSLYSRVSRSTLNIGVCGEMRMGKSTLLGSISGLDQSVIPRREGPVVTAVRSRIHHSPERKAKLTFHSWEGFREAVLREYHKTLDLREPPTTIDDFSNYHYPTDAELDKYDEHRRMLARQLLAIQGALPSYKGDLKGGDSGVSLNELLPYITYPKDEIDREGNPCPRKYLAVKRADIFCPFVDGINRLVLIDMPGLGELRAGTPDQYVAGLGDEIDLVLYVKRPDSNRNANIGDTDARILSLLEKAGEPVQRKDFIIFVINDGGCPPKLIETLQQEISNKKLGSDLQILRGNAIDKNSVRRDIVRPVLDHLRCRLGAMDSAALRNVRNAMRDTCRSLREALTALLKELRAIEGQLPNADIELEDRARKLKEEVAQELANIRERHWDLAEQRESDSVFVSEINKVKENVNKWLDQDYKSVRESWIDDRTKRMYDKMGPGTVAEEEFGAARLRIWKEFKGIKTGLDTPIMSLCGEIAGALRQHLTREVVAERPGDRGGRDALKEFRKGLEEMRCATLVEAIDDLLNVQIDFASHILPPIRAGLNRLADPELIRKSWGDGATATPATTGETSMAADPLTSEEDSVPGATVEADTSRLPSFDEFERRFAPQETGPINSRDRDSKGGPQPQRGSYRAYAEQLHKNLTRIILEIVPQITEKLTQRAAFTSRIVYAVAAQFYESFILPKEAEREFKRLSKEYRDRLWPDFSQGIHGLRETVANAGRETEVVLDALWKPEGSVPQLARPPSVGRIDPEPSEVTTESSIDTSVDRDRGESTRTGSKSSTPTGV